MKPKSSPLVRFSIFIVVMVVILTAGAVWWFDGISPVDSSEESVVTFVVEKGESVRSIANRLADADLIRSPTTFFVLVKTLGLDGSIQAGDFRLSKSMNAEMIAQELTHGIVDVWVTTLEGWRIDEIATKLAKELDIPEQEFLRVAKEGYMFPDTYLLPRTASASAIVDIFLHNFDKKIPADMRTQGANTGLTFPEIITLASIVEREGRSDTDRPVIAGILLNRLKEDWPLQADATLQYALGYQSQQKTWWKSTLFNEDKEVKSPYNTYLNKGLPPGPISNPGLSSIRAVLSPQTSDYWFYLHDPKGGVHYAKTLEEHNQNIEDYLR